MSETVISVDFGKENREAAQKLGRLLGLVEEQDAELLSDPRRLFSFAMEEIQKRDNLIREARDALRPSVMPEYDPAPLQMRLQTVNVEADEYRRMKAAAEIIQRGVD